MPRLYACLGVTFLKIIKLWVSIRCWPMLCNSELFINEFRVKTARWLGWDYGRNGWYFVTICTKDKVHYFGEIKNNKMYLSNIGKVAKRCWLDIPKHFKNVVLDAYVIMPNHVHGIVVIGNQCRDEACLVSTPVTTMNDDRLRISYKPQSLPAIIGSYKSACTKIINEKYSNLNWQWQSRFYDHVIRDKHELYEIRRYIQNNPLMWRRDRNNI